MYFVPPPRRGVLYARHPRLLRAELRGLPALQQCLFVHHLQLRAFNAAQKIPRNTHQPRARNNTRLTPGELRTANR